MSIVSLGSGIHDQAVAAEQDLLTLEILKTAQPAGSVGAALYTKVQQEQLRYINTATQLLYSEEKNVHHEKYQLKYGKSLKGIMALATDLKQASDVEIERRLWAPAVNTTIQARSGAAHTTNNRYGFVNPTDVAPGLNTPFATQPFLAYQLADMNQV